MNYDNVALSKRWFEEVWNQGRAETVSELFAADGVSHGMGEGGGDILGSDGFKAFQAQYLAAFPDLRMEVEEVIADGDRVAIRFSGRGTHTGDQLGITPTLKTVSFTGMSFTHWKDGKMQEAWNNVDMLAISLQINAVQAVQQDT